MAYKDNNGSKPTGFYSNRGTNRSHGVNTGEWTRADYEKRDGHRSTGQARREHYDDDAGDRRRQPPKGDYDRERSGQPRGNFQRERPEQPKADFHRDRPEQPKGDFRRERSEPPKGDFHRDRPQPPRGDYRGDHPQRGTRDFRRTSDRPIYEDAFEPAPNAEPLESNILVGRNPIREAVKSGRDIEKILVQRGELSGSAREIIAKARERRIVVQEVDKTRLDEIYPNHQGMIAYASAASYSTVDDILARADERGEKPFIVVLDGVTDPHNLGAIIRTAECAGAHGVIIGQRRSVGLTPAAVKASAGAVEYMPVARVVNITRTLSELKQKDIWVIGAAMDGTPIAQSRLDGAVAIVIGAEGEGLSRLVREECDMTVALPMKGHIESLNASVAAGIIMYAVTATRG